LRGRGVGCCFPSGRDRRRFGLAGELHHLIDPATGEPAVPGPLAATVVALNAVSAEAHATALAITPIAESSRYVAARPHISALIVPAAGTPFIAGDLPTGVPAWARDVAS
jgi:thiamine biosynthesis lipoprotein ApbE